MPVAIRHDDLRKRNRAMVISSVRRAGQASRTEIAAVTGLSHSTISSISADLIGEGILQETKDAEPAATRRGRPQVAIELNPEAATVVTIVLLYNLLAGCVVDFAGTAIAGNAGKLTTAELSPEALVCRCVGLVEAMLAQPAVAGRRIDRITFAVQGTTDAARRVMLWSPITPHGHIDLATGIEAAFGVPVTVENDCNMIAVALQSTATARRHHDFIAVLLSHGIGMGLVLDGRPFTGTHTSGGEFGHMVYLPGGALCRCGQRGCIEAYAGNYAIARFARGQSEDELSADDLDIREIAAIGDVARRSEGREREAFRRAGAALGYGLGSLFALIDPAPVTLVGDGAAAFDLIEPAMRAALASTAGGRHADAITFDTEPDEMPLIELGCAMRALTQIDQEVLAAGVPAQAEAVEPA
ncbi:MAG: ROK family protein [Rhizobiaceae bacterium]|nr:ROK family protein [Rhizobiaceae bacterium]